MTTQQRMNREARKDSIERWLDGAVHYCTIAEIARALKLAKSPWLRKLLDEMEREGRLVSEEVILWNGTSGKGWRVRRPHHAWRDLT